MKEQYSTLDIVKALKIPRGRLREWIDHSFIIPSVSAEGQGTKAVLTRTDVYGVALFRQLLKLGFSRTMASRITRDFVSREKAQTRGKARYLVFKIGEKNGEPAILTSRIFSRNCNINIETLEAYEQEALDQGPSTEWREAYDRKLIDQGLSTEWLEAYDRELLNQKSSTERREVQEREALYQEPSTEWSSVIIINFQHLQEETDAALKEA